METSSSNAADAASIDQQTQQQPATGEQTQSDDTLGPAGVKALEEFKRRARENEAKAKRADQLEAELEKIRDANRSESEKAVERARREATDAARKEVLGQANRRILTAEIRAAAGGRLADPLDAVRMLDVDAFSVNDNGEVDSAAITKALDALLEAKPYLGAGTKRFEGSADAGPRGAADESANVTAGLGRLVAGYSKSKK